MKRFYLALVCLLFAFSAPTYANNSNRGTPLGNTDIWCIANKAGGLMYFTFRPSQRYTNAFLVISRGSEGGTLMGHWMILGSTSVMIEWVDGVFTTHLMEEMFPCRL